MGGKVTTAMYKFCAGEKIFGANQYQGIVIEQDHLRSRVSRVRDEEK